MGYFNAADADAIAKIKIPPRRMEDFLAWPLEKSGLFAVCSAYDLGLRLQNLYTCAASSSASDGSRKLWQHVWKGNVPPKVNVFTWKLCRDALPTRRRKYIKHMEKEDVCQLCGMGRETGHHATVVCPQARNLRTAMREHWSLPGEEQFAYTSPDCLLLLLERCSLEQRDLVKLLLWRTWTSHNNIVHQSGSFRIEDSVHRLLNIRETSLNMKEATVVSHDTGKGKEIIGDSDQRRESKMQEEQLSRAKWTPPKEGWTKINVDGSYVEQSGEAGIGVIARNCEGKVIFTAWRPLSRCASALEAEALACVEGFRLASQWAQGPITLESDCSQMVKALKADEDRSEICFMLAEARELAQLLDRWEVIKVRRESNSIAHELAHLARGNCHTAVWLSQ